MALPVLLHPREGRSASVGSLVPAPLIPPTREEHRGAGNRSWVPPCQAPQLFLSAEAPRLYGTAVVSRSEPARWGPGLPLPVTDPPDEVIYRRAPSLSSALPQLTAVTIYSGARLATSTSCRGSFSLTQLGQQKLGAAEPAPSGNEGLQKQTRKALASPFLSFFPLEPIQMEHKQGADKCRVRCHRESTR